MPTFSDMVYHSGGVPALSGGLPIVAGNVYWVSSLLGSSANDGTKDKPFNTLSRALDFSTINDCIMLMPGHVENITTTGVFAIDQAGTIVWGLGSYDYRPTFTHNTAAAYAKIEAANVWVHNIKFVAGTTATAHGLYVEAVGAKVTNCVFEEVVASTYCYHDALITGGTDNEADGLHVENCIFYQPTAAGSGSIIIDGAHNDLNILNNQFTCGWSSGGTGGAAILMADTATVYNLNIGWNRISHSLTSGTVGVSVATVAGYGFIYNNYIQNESTVSDPSGGISVSATTTIGCFENYFSGESVESGVLAPAAYSTS
jgi:hypothetical protein